MKITIAFVLLISTAFAAFAGTYTISTDTTVGFKLTIAANSANSSNYDFTVVGTKAAALTAEKFYGISCVDTTASDFTLTADNSALKGWAVQAKTAASKTDFDTAATNTQLTLTVKYTNSGTKYESTANAAQATAPTFTAAADTITYAYSALTPATSVANNFPNSSQTHYYKCFSTITADAAIANQEFTGTFAATTTNIKVGSATALGLTMAGFLSVLAAFSTF